MSAPLPRSISGTRAAWLRDNHNLFVRFGLNLADADAVARNHGAQLQMLTDARLATAPGRVIPNAVVVSAGAAVSIQVRSRSPVGFGFRIATEAQPVVDRLYAVDRPDAEGYRTATVRRFQHLDRLVTVELMRGRLSDRQDLSVLQQLWTCDISTWALHQFLDPIAGRVFNKALPRFAPTPARPRDRPDTREAIAASAGARGGGNGGDPAHPIAAGVIWADGAAEQRFERIQVQAEDDPERQRIGMLRVHFFVLDPA